MQCCVIIMLDLFINILLVNVISAKVALQNPITRLIITRSFYNNSILHAFRLIPNPVRSQQCHGSISSYDIFSTTQLVGELESLMLVATGKVGELLCLFTELLNL